VTSDAPVHASRVRGGAVLRGAGIVLMLATLVALVGCRTTKPDGATAEGTTSVVPEAPAPTWEEIADAQRLRLERLLPFRAGGAVELRWRDGGSRRFETCRGDLMLRTITESALDLRKVGERFLLVGSDDTRQWIFDVRRGEEAAWIRSRGTPWADDGPPITAEVDLAELFGFFAVDDQPLRAPRWDPDSGAVELILGPVAMPRRLLLDPTTFLPRRIEVHDPAGALLVGADLDNYDPVERVGLPPGARPRFPTRVRLRTGDGEGEISLFLIPPETTPRLPERLFSLDALLETFRPAVVHRSGDPDGLGDR